MHLMRENVSYELKNKTKREERKEAEKSVF